MTPSAPPRIGCAIYRARPGGYRTRGGSIGGQAGRESATRFSLVFAGQASSLLGTDDPYVKQFDAEGPTAGSLPSAAVHRSVTSGAGPLRRPRRAFGVHGTAARAKGSEQQK